jgi:hypothetical protein
MAQLSPFEQKKRKVTVDDSRARSKTVHTLHMVSPQGYVLVLLFVVPVKRQSLVCFGLYFFREANSAARLGRPKRKLRFM